MKLQENEFIVNTFGESAKWLDLSEYGLTGIVFRSNTTKISRYDEIHLGKFISSGRYLALLKALYVHFKIDKKLLFEVEYSVLKLHIITSGKTIKVLKSFTIGLFYDRQVDEILKNAYENITYEAIHDINTRVDSVKKFFMSFKKEELSSNEDIERSIDLYKKISPVELTGRDIGLIKRYAKSFN